MLSVALWTWRDIRAITLALALVITSGCHKKFRERASVVRTADAKTKEQLLGGFYEVEGTGWRWAARHFAVALKPPSEAASKGFRVKLDFYIPDSQINALGPMTLSAIVDDGCPLDSETFSSGGSFSYVKDIPISEAAANVVRVDFLFDRAKSPAPSDRRELTAVVSSVALETK
jgi:hypothetical protein